MHAVVTPLGIAAHHRHGARDPERLADHPGDENGDEDGERRTGEECDPAISTPAFANANTGRTTAFTHGSRWCSHRDGRRRPIATPTTDASTPACTSAHHADRAEHDQRPWRAPSQRVQHDHRHDGRDRAHQVPDLDVVAVEADEYRDRRDVVDDGQREQETRRRVDACADTRASAPNANATSVAIGMPHPRDPARPCSTTA